MPSPFPGSDPSRQPWLESIATGDTGLAAAFEHYRLRLRGVVELRLGHLLRTRIDPSDVLQEAFLDAVRLRERYAREPRVSVFVWLRGIAMNRLENLRRDHIEARKRSVRLEVDLPEDSTQAFARQLLQDAPSPSDQAALREHATRVRTAVERLPEADREIILLRYFEFLSNREAAEILGIAETAAAMRHGRAIIRLRALLDAPDSRVSEDEP